MVKKPSWKIWYSHEFVNGKDDMPYIILWKIKFMFQTTKQYGSWSHPLWLQFLSVHFFGIWSTCWKNAGNYSCRNKHPIFGHPTQVQKEFLHRFAGGPVRLKLASELSGPQLWNLRKWSNLDDPISLIQLTQHLNNRFFLNTFVVWV